METVFLRHVRKGFEGKQPSHLHPLFSFFCSFGSIRVHMLTVHRLRIYLQQAKASRTNNTNCGKLLGLDFEDGQLLQRCFHEWMAIQEQELKDLTQALDQNQTDGNLTESACAQLTEKSVNSFQDYIDKRAGLSRQDISGLFSPSWNTTLENSMLWIAGCRPSIYIRLTYALCGSQVEFQLGEIIQGLARGSLAQVSATQLRMVNDLHIKTIKEEEKLSSQFASLQENIADQPIAMVAKKLSHVGEPSGEVDRVLDEHEVSMSDILQEADKLRLNTLKELLGFSRGE